MRTRRMSIEKKILFSIMSISTISILLISIISYKTLSDNLINGSKDRAMTVAELASNNINGDVLEGFVPGDEGTKEYDSMCNELREYLVDDEFCFIYTMKPLDDENFQFIVDADESEDRADIGEA